MVGDERMIEITEEMKERYHRGIYIISNSDYTMIRDMYKDMDMLRKAADYQKKKKKYYRGEEVGFKVKRYPDMEETVLTWRYGIGNPDDIFEGAISGYMPMPFIEVDNNDGYLLIKGYVPWYEKKIPHYQFTLVDNTHWPAMTRSKILIVPEEPEKLEFFS